MDWRRSDGSLDTAAFLSHALSVLGDPAERVGLDLDAVRATIVTRPVWHLEAACRGMGPTPFFAAGGTLATRHAVAVCAGCPVAEQCRAAGVEGDEIGVWGGVRRPQRAPRGGLAAAFLARRARHTAA